MTEATGPALHHLSPATSWLGATFARPKLIAVLCVLVLAGLGWSMLGLQAAGALDVLCQAMPGKGSVAVIAGMWAAMTLAMMLPSAAPMILTYAEIADTAAGKGEPVVTPFAIATGYTVVWLGFALVATLVQIMLARAALLNASMIAVNGLFSGAIFIAAGAYQFSALKQACLKQCQQPFSFFFVHWKTTPRGVFGLGVKQGLYCLGCCWAMMLVMFAVGVMNMIWMAALGIVMGIEKLGTGKRFTRIVGVALIAIGVVFMLSSVIAHWPEHRI